MVSGRFAFDVAGQICESRSVSGPGKPLLQTMKVQNWIVVLALFFTGILSAGAQGTVFSYEGRLSDGGQPANGTNYGMVFYLFDAATNGTVLGNFGVASVAVSNGLFSTPLNFGSQFDGTPRWLEITVQKNGGSFTTLSPRQQILAVPYAIMANSASNLLGTLPVAQLVGTVPLAQLPGTILTNNASGVLLDGYFNGSYFGNGFNVTNERPENLVTGYASAQLSLTNGYNIINGFFNGSYFGNGFNVTNERPENLVSGYAGAQLSLTNGYNIINGFFNGSYFGNGFNVTNARPENLVSGYASAALSLTNGQNVINGYHYGDASGLTHVPVDGITGGLTINLPVLVPGGGTNTLCFTNGILRAIK